MGRWLAARIEGALSRHQRARVWQAFESQSVLGENAQLYSTADCVNLGEPADIEIGSNFICRGTLRREAFGGKIRIADGVYIGDYSLISCAEEVSIGSNVLVAFNVCIFDNDSHPVHPSHRSEHLQALLSVGHVENEHVGRAPVRIEDDVWIGFGSVILKGVTIGEGAIVGAGSVVTRDVAPRTVVAGNPARVVREIG